MRTISSTPRFPIAIVFALLLTACASTPDPEEAANADYGPYPENYEEVVMTYLEANPDDVLDPTITRFLNKPNKFATDYRKPKYGYRVCALVSTRDGAGMKSNFFLVNNGQVIEHFHDSGLLRLSSDFCNLHMLAVEKNAVAPIAEVPVETTPVDVKGFKYLVCNLEGKERFFAFSPEKRELHEQDEGDVVRTFALDNLSDTFIVASEGGDRMSVNRISGTMRYVSNGADTTGSCELSNKQKF